MVVLQRNGPGAHTFVVYITISNITAFNCLDRREMAQKYNIKYFYDIVDLSNFKANPDYKGVCHVALAQVGSGRDT